MRKLAEILLARWSLWLITFVAALPAMFAVCLGLQEVQSRYVPIVVDFEVQRFEHLSPARIEIWGQMTKRFEYGDRLPACRYAGMNWFAVLPDGQLREANWWTLERPLGQTINRQPGHQTFGPWIIDFAGVPKPNEVYAVVDHWCWVVWPTRTKLGPLKLTAG